MKRKRDFLKLLLVLSLTSCISIPRPNVILPQQPVEKVQKECPIPPKINKLAEKVYINIDTKVQEVDDGGEQLILDVAGYREWRKRHYP